MIKNILKNIESYKIVAFMFHLTVPMESVVSANETQ